MLSPIGRCIKWAVCMALVLIHASGTDGSILNFHKTCICASNIVSCSKMNLTTVPVNLPNYTAVLDLSYNDITRLRAEWTTYKLPKLHNLLLSHNSLHFISTEAFVYVRHLRYLDLSSNNLRQLDEYIFEQLEHLEVLLLYNNHISQIDRTAFSGMISLQKLYLSQNLVSRFPVELVKNKTRLQKLSLLDLSSNRIKVLPIPELQSLPAWLKNGLYLHNNSLICNCELYSLMTQWFLRRLNSAVDFRDDYTCIPPGADKKILRVFELNVHMNCSTFNESMEETFLGQTLVLNCDTRHREMSKTWMLPGNIIASPGNNHSVEVFPDGILKISSVKLEDSGQYTCFAVSEHLNETLYVWVKVHNFTVSGTGDTLNTGYTTLVGCLASVVLVLIYLYLTPCRCFCCPGQGKPKNHHEDSIHSSILSATPTHEDMATKAELSRHVAFIDPKDLQGQNGKVNPSGVEELDDEARQGKGMRKKSVADSISSVFSDTPIVV
ncbi:amphoterin-induced protein 1 [Electrophorus electricus]|uniref:amphoterin-induced protein 1 n=1 Tax=Electrophorus electricus TaxID=8005 RepID=UPI0015CFECCA|nr:amphoterin-induced protein 1 [Electrophorus electricus]XP_026862878.2 amphoterin-induced protein 1 [Electrophorus electricus]XP_026862879.2 amphoterin-induced protein 1 [Electrophorus electricus]